MTDEQTESMFLGGLEFRDRSSNGSDGSAGNGRVGNGQGSSGPDVRNGTIVSGEEKAERDHAGESGPVVVDRSHVPPGVLESMRKQVADFADFAHRTRIVADSADALQALGCGGGITAAVVEQMAAELYRMKAAPSLGADQRTQTDSLLLSLVAPQQPENLTERQRQAFISWRGRLALDVSMSPVEGEPTTTVVRMHDAPERQLPAGGGQVGEASDADLTAPCAVVILGSAAYIAEERPYLSLDRLMAYARSKAYRSGGPAGAPEAQSAGLQAARNLEIVVLLDRWLDGGLWIDVDRSNGRPAAALAIGVSLTDVRFTHIPELRVPKLRTLAAGLATA